MGHNQVWGRTTIASSARALVGHIRSSHWTFIFTHLFPIASTANLGQNNPHPKPWSGKIHLLGSIEKSSLSTRGVCTPGTVPRHHMGIRPLTSLLLLLRGRDTIHPGHTLPDMPGLCTIRHAQGGTRGTSKNVPHFAQAPSQIHQSKVIRCVRWERSGYGDYDIVSPLCYRACGSGLQCLDVHGLWVFVCQLAHFDSFRGGISVGASLSVFGIGHGCGSSCASQVFQVQFWAFVHVVRLDCGIV